MITIKIGHNQDPVRAMQKLKNKVIAEGLFQELKKRRFYACLLYTSDAADE